MTHQNTGALQLHSVHRLLSALTVDELMPACTAALQLIGPGSQQTQTGAGTSGGLPPAVEAVMPCPRQPIGDAVSVGHGSRGVPAVVTRRIW